MNTLKINITGTFLWEVETKANEEKGYPAKIILTVGPDKKGKTIQIKRGSTDQTKYEPGKIYSIDVDLFVMNGNSYWTSNSGKLCKE